MSESDDIRMLDERGQEVRIPRKDWIEKVLPDNLQRAGDNPDALYAMLMLAVRDNLAAHVVDASAKLVEIDPNRERAIVMRGAVLMQSGQPEQAETLFNDYLAANGPSGAVLTNLARIYHDRGELGLAEETLRQALGRDPNLDNGLGWYAALQRQRGGDEAYVAALKDIASIPGSWRPQLWLARDLLRKNQTDAAVDIYRSVLAAGPLPADGMTQMTGDLGSAGKIPQMLQLAAPVFDLQKHGPVAALNILHGLLAVGEVAQAEQVLAALEQQKNPALGRLLADAAGRIRQAKQPRPAIIPNPAAANALPGGAATSGTGPSGAASASPSPAPPAGAPRPPGPGVGDATPPPEQMQIAAVPLLNPIWTPPLNRPHWLLPQVAPDAVKVLFFSLADTTRQTKDNIGGAVAEPVSGVMSRAIPLYLAESLRFTSTALTACVIPVLPGNGPVVNALPWPLPQMVAATPPEFAADYLICGAIARGARGLRVELHVFGAKDRSSLKTLRVPIADDFAGVGQKVRQEVLNYLATLGVQSIDTPAIPLPEDADHYMRSLDHLFGQMLAAGGLLQGVEMAQEQRIYPEYLAAAEKSDISPLPVLVAAAGLLAGLRYRSPLAEQHQAQFLALTKLASARFDAIRKVAPAIYLRLGDQEAYTQALAAAQQGDDADYTQWLAGLAT